MTEYLLNKTPTKTGHNKKVGFSHVFYKDIPLNEDNIFLAIHTENNYIEQTSFKKSKLYAISGLSID